MNASTGRTAPRVLGIDPGDTDTGLCVRADREVLAQLTIHRVSEESFGGRGIAVGPRYVAQVLAAVAGLVDEHAPELVACESVVEPNPHVNRRNGRSLTKVGPILGASVVLGAITAAYPEVVWVPPGKNGSMPLFAYPAELVTDHERRHGLNRIGGGSLRHVRSAFDVAGQARTFARMRASKPA